MMTARGLIDDFAFRRYRRLALPLLVIGIGAATPAFEIARAIVQPVNPPRSDDLFTAWNAPASRGTSMATYIVPKSSFNRTWLFKSVPKSSALSRPK